MSIRAFFGSDVASVPELHVSQNIEGSQLNRDLPNRDVAKITGRLNLAFAILTCLGGLVLASGTEGDFVPMIAVFFAVFGFLFVDWLKLFSLPPIAAYAAMGLAALYCVSDFFGGEAPGNHQMIAVAQLLVLVQAIMMLQTKTRRIFEQLGVFCLLELVVAAVFNNAIHYGLLLLPICVVGGWALTMLASVSTVEGMCDSDFFQSTDSSPSKLPSFLRAADQDTIHVNASDATAVIAKSGLRLPKIVLLAVGPAVVLIATIFFYALPRTTEATRANSPRNALVGFNTEMKLEQIGQMSQNSAIAAQIQLRDRATGLPYQAIGELYLRGAVLERYQAQFHPVRNTATWTSISGSTIDLPEKLPSEYFPARPSDSNFYDNVSVQVSCESSKSPALFAIAPYFEERSTGDIVHYPDQWTLSRDDANAFWYGRANYTFGTHAFRAGVQNSLIGRTEVEIHANEIEQVYPEGLYEGESERLQNERRKQLIRQQKHDSYVKELVDFKEGTMPTVERIADSFVYDDRGRQRNSLQLAKALEANFALSGDFQYSLNLDAKSMPGMDPIEQFVSIDRSGHCQYYASALAMMLRSQGVPARLVVGYRTDEFNELTGRYVARQLHAHAWVEALIPADQIERTQTVYGQPDTTEYWVRLDPTPATRESNDDSSVGQVLDLAQTMWDDYVVDMDAERQESAIGAGPTGTAMQQSYSRLVDRLSSIINSIRADELGGGSLATRNLFSWPAAVIGIALAIVSLILIRLRPPNWLRRRSNDRTGQEAPLPQIAFYQQTLQQLKRVGVTRKTNQTPRELRLQATDQLQHPMVPSVDSPLQVLTDAFYRIRFGSEPIDANPASSARTDLDNLSRVDDASATNAQSRTNDRDAELESSVALALKDLSRSIDLLAISDQQKR
ncbi:Protein-glutamine gamma-glutamyltransferase [Rubripirellula amarantea]|uniref:Protein-glutamine gamma-glutamyltransferase n=1 Tax=Rubripirellula amarantea TaxID=2527999 RepID=A0A5C5WNH4_9BACT|nr:transglutaminaseTgpA domain-containing protein [Rubripirellula amarantea]TWT51372.1 Protein-glutamine gamma-glutamyltransferase [Rubripirellula amarantea]